jgi:hypothetical protein
MTWILYDQTFSPIVAEIERELRSQSHRGTAVIAGGLLDELLKQAIKSRIRYTQSPSMAKKMLFDVARPLSSTDAKINLGVLLGLYREEIWTDLRSVNEVRNAFAHILECRDFTFPTVSRKCEEFWSPKHVSIESIDGAYEPPPDDARGKFILTVKILVAILGLVINDPCAPPEPKFI